MAEEETNSRIEELKARLEANPESRVFYQLGEELRKSGQAEEAETILRTGLEKHSSYLSAWISLGRVLKETGRAEEAIEVLNRAFELDRQNVVVARLLGDVYDQTGEHVEAIKKYKLVAALHPADEEVQQKINQLEVVLAEEGTLEAPATARPAPPAPSPQSDELSTETVEPAEAGAEVFESEQPVPDAEVGPAAEPDRSPLEPESAQDAAVEDQGEEPFGVPVAETQQDVPSGQEPTGSDLETPELTREDEGAVFGAGFEADQEERAPERSGSEGGDDVVATVTMGDLYARQGHVEQAREIYRKVLSRNPEHPDAAARLSSLDQQKNAIGGEQASAADSTTAGSKIHRLEEWLSKVNRQ